MSTNVTPGTVVSSPAMRVVGTNASTISLIAQAAGDANGGATTATIGGRQIVTVPSGQAGLTGNKGPVQITITPANRGNISTITLPSNIRQITKPIVVGAPSANGSAQVVSLGQPTAVASPQVVTVTQPTVTVTQPTVQTPSETEAATEALVGQPAAKEGDSATVPQFDGVADNDCGKGVDWRAFFDDHNYSDELSHHRCTESPRLVELDASDDESTLDDVGVSFCLPQFDGADDELAGGEKAEGDKGKMEATQQESTTTDVTTIAETNEESTEQDSTAASSVEAEVNKEPIVAGDEGAEETTAAADEVPAVSEGMAAGESEPMEQGNVENNEQGTEEESALVPEAGAVPTEEAHIPGNQPAEMSEGGVKEPVESTAESTAADSDLQSMAQSTGGLESLANHPVMEGDEMGTCKTEAADEEDGLDSSQTDLLAQALQVAKAEALAAGLLADGTEPMDTDAAAEDMKEGLLEAANAAVQGNVEDNLIAHFFGYLLEELSLGRS